MKHGQKSALTHCNHLQPHPLNSPSSQRAPNANPRRTQRAFEVQRLVRSGLSQQEAFCVSQTFFLVACKCFQCFPLEIFGLKAEERFANGELLPPTAASRPLARAVLASCTKPTIAEALLFSLLRLFFGLLRGTRDLRLPSRPLSRPLRPASSGRPLLAALAALVVPPIPRPSFLSRKRNWKV